MKEDFAPILDGLRRLREAATAPRVFGSAAHGFRTHPPLPEQAVRAFEARHGVVLPLEYSAFLIHVGNGGAGPAYGVFKLGEMDDTFGGTRWAENDGFVGVLSRPFPHAAAWNDLVGKPVHDESREHDPLWEEDYQQRLDAWEERTYWNTANVDGAVPVCHHGCALRQWLVVTGPESGHVWDDDRADHGGLKPVQQPGRSRVTFLQWYRAWLDEALRQSARRSSVDPGDD